MAQSKVAIESKATSAAWRDDGDAGAGARRRRRGCAVAIATGGLAALVCAELYVAGGGGVRGGGLALSYLSGMTMLVLPCTLPMVFVIVPMVIGRSAKAGIGMAAAFGAGVSITLSAYGALVALAGHFIGMNGATKAMWVVGGVAAYGFGLSQLGLVRLRLPSYRGPLPRFMAGEPGIGRAFLVGLMLGNAGIGCPCPPWYLLLGGVATSGNPAYGAAIGLVQGLGRMTPLLAVAVAAVLGVDWSRSLARRRRGVERASGGALVVIGSVIVVFMALAHAWWEWTPLHADWNLLLRSLGGGQISEIGPAGGPYPASLWWAPWLFCLLVGGPAVAIAARTLKSRRAKEAPERLAKGLRGAR